MHAVAIFTTVQVRHFGKLPRMFIDVAVRAKLKPDPVDRYVSLRNVALRAVNR
jgi:hypothetical protein